MRNPADLPSPRPMTSSILFGRGFLFGLFIIIGLSAHDSQDAYCAGADCPPCGQSYCYDPAAARPLKAAKKAAAIRRGLPERLAKAFDEIADCPGCVSITPDWVSIVVEYDVEAMEKKYGPGKYWTSMGQAWSPDAELQARNDMREGVVKSIHFILARYPCRCCPERVAERASFTYPDDENAWMETPGWNEDLNFHQASVVDEITSPNDLGPDPEDLTNIPESAKRPPVDLEICGGPEVPPAREVHVVCEACRPHKEEHDQYSRWIHDAQIRLRALKRGQCILAQVINGARRELAATNRLASTPQTEARMDALQLEIEQRMEDYQSDQRKMGELETNIRDMEAKRQAALAGLARCEELCRQPPPVEEVAQAPDECTGDDCPRPIEECTGPGCTPSECTGPLCPPPGACTGDDCPPPVDECTGPGCTPSECTGPGCPPPGACTGDDCPPPAACTGDDCDMAREECNGGQCAPAPPFRINAGDMDDDGVVNETDTTVFVQKWTQLNVGPARDVDGDGDFDVNDAKQIAREHPTDQDGDGDVDQDDRDAISHQLGGMTPVSPAPAVASQDGDEGIPTAVEQPALGGRIADNESPRPQDRMYFNYNYFSNLQPNAVRTAPLMPGMQDGGLELRTSGSGAQRIAPGGSIDLGFADPVLYIEALGGSTGPVARALVVNPGSEPLELDGYVAVEPVQISPSQRERILDQVRSASGALQELTANFYCLELLKLAPPDAIVYRIANAAKQARFAPAARALDSARRLYESGGMAVEGDPDTYFHSIRQWAVWTLEQSFDREAFLDAFTEHARKNFERMGQAWSAPMEAAVRQHAERRWTDVTQVLEEGSRNGS